jgi:hypothetical protein
MTFNVSPATLDDVQGIVDVRFTSNSRVFPDTPAVREWYAKSVRKGMEKGQNTVFMVVKEDDCTMGRVVSFSRWILHPGGGLVPSWRERWVSEIAEGMSEELVKGYFEPMARQHDAIMGTRPHYCECHFQSTSLHRIQVRPSLTELSTSP